MPYRPTQFHLTVIKPYYKDDSSEPVKDAPENAPEDTLEDAPENPPEDALEENYNQYTPEGDYDSNIIVVDIPQL
jgi:hypothetical protein